MFSAHSTYGYFHKRFHVYGLKTPLIVIDIQGHKAIAQQKWEVLYKSCQFIHHSYSCQTRFSTQERKGKE